jgi:hypothetical protein
MSDVQFEIYRQAQGSGSWVLVEALEDREHALERARRMLQERRATAVRVVKQSFDPATGGYVGVTLLEDGRVNTKKKNTKIDELEDLPACDTTDDLYSHQARAVIARTLGDWLAQHKLTVTELLHSAAALQKLDTQGLTLQHAIQKVAIARAFGSNRPVTQFVRQLGELCSTGMRRVYKDEKSGLFEGGTNGFRALVEAIGTEPSAEYRLNGVVAKHLRSAKSWDEKLAMLLAFMADLPEDDEPRERLVTIIDSVAAEILTIPSAYTNLLGANSDLGRALVHLTSLFLGEESAERSPVANALSAFFKRDILRDARAAVAARLLSELRGAKRLCPGSWDAELASLRQLAPVLARATGKYLSHDDVVEALAQRSRRYVAHEPLVQYLQDTRSPDQKVERLLAAEQSIVGAESKRELATFIVPLIGLRAFEEQLGSGVMAKLKRIAELRDRVFRSGFPEVQKNQLASALAGVAKTIEERARLLASLETRVTDPVERAHTLMALSAAGALTQADMQAKARRIMNATLAAPGFLSAYVMRRRHDNEDTGSTDEILQELTATLRQFGITPEEAMRALGMHNVVLI